LKLIERAKSDSVLIDSSFQRRLGNADKRLNNGVAQSVVFLVIGHLTELFLAFQRFLIVRGDTAPEKLAPVLLHFFVGG